MIAVTSFSQTGYEKYGKRMLESAIKHWPTEIIVYHEGKEPDLKHEKISYRNLFDITGIVPFLQHIQNVPKAHGKWEGGYDYNFDCWKFCRKVFAQLAVLKGDDHDKVFWLDADLEFKKDVPEYFLNGLLPSAVAVAYLGRTGWYTETGFVGFNKQSHRFDDFIRCYEECYRKGIIFTLRRWHDCEAFDWARAKSEVTGHNLSMFYINGKTDIDVLSQSVLAEYMTHHKGPSKNREVFERVSLDAQPGNVFRSEPEETRSEDRGIN